jgi:hypothetical protein
VKYEEVYLKDYTHVFAARENLEAYFTFYNEERGHGNVPLVVEKGDGVVSG